MPTWRGLVLVPVAAGLAAGGAAYGVEEFVLLALAIAAALAGAELTATWSARRVRRDLRVELVRPTRELAVGDDAAISLVAVNTGRRRMPGLLVDDRGGWSVSLPGLAGTSGAPAGAASEDRGARLRRALHRGLDPLARVVAPSAPRCRHLESLAPGATAVTSLAVPTGRRGLWSLAPRRAWYADPLGLVAHPVARSPGAHLVVCPRPVHRVGGDVVAAGLGGPEVTVEAHGLTRRPRGGGDELAALRQYRAGDRLNRLHWPALARTGELVVREFVEPEAPSVELYVDDRPLIVEGAVQHAARLGLDALDDGVVVTVQTGAGERRTVAPGPSARRTLLEALAVVPPAARWAR